MKVLCIRTSGDAYSELGGKEILRNFMPKIIKDKFYYVSEWTSANNNYTYTIHYEDNDESYLGIFLKKHFITIDELREKVIDKILDND
jgi:hypothetical protein